MNDTRVSSLSSGLAEWGAYLRRTSYKRVIAETGTAPPGTLRALTALGGRALQREDYVRLLSLLEDFTVGSVLRHSTRITTHQLRAIDCLPADYRSAKILHQIRRASDATRVIASIRSLERLLPAIPRKRLAQSFNAQNSIKQLTSWVDNKALDAVFPPPPWPGSSRLQPVTNGADLARVRRSFNNCVLAFIEEILIGTHYFYLWVERSSCALILVKRTAYHGWCIDQARGPDNKRLTARMLNRMKVDIRESGFIDPDISAEDYIDRIGRLP